MDSKAEERSGKLEDRTAQMSQLESQKEELKELKAKEIDLLEKISGLTAEEAKEYLLKNIESEVIKRNLLINKLPIFIDDVFEEILSFKPSCEANKRKSA